MKDQIINGINKSNISKKRLLTVSAFSLIGTNLLLTILITHFKHPEMINMTDATLVKSFFWNFS